jgi:hypothetical protein
MSGVSYNPALVRIVAGAVNTLGLTVPFSGR